MLGDIRPHLSCSVLALFLLNVCLCSCCSSRFSCVLFILPFTDLKNPFLPPVAVVLVNAEVVLCGLLLLRDRKNRNGFSDVEENTEDPYTGE